jgi:formate dehydrogenase (hydrogenase)
VRAGAAGQAGRSSGGMAFASTGCHSACRPANDVDPVCAPTVVSMCRQLLVRKVRSMSKQVRLTEPLVRENGRLRPASWDEALDRAAAGFAAARERDATKSFGMFSCSKATNEMNYMAQKFTRAVMGSNNIDSCNRT